MLALYIRVRCRLLVSLVVEILKLNLPLSQENVCICMPSTSYN